MSDAPGWEGPLPEPVRLRVVALASDTLGAMTQDDVPAGLKPYRNWAPARRTRRAATPLALAVERDPAFRARTYAWARAQEADLAEALEAGQAPPAADPVELAALAYLGRTQGWVGLLSAVGAELDRAGAAERSRRAADELARLQAELTAALAARRDEVEAASAEASAVRAELATVQKALREEKGARRRAERAAAEAEEQVAAVRTQAADEVAAAQQELARAVAQKADAEASLAAARAAAREGRSLEDVRLRLLLDTVMESAAGLRRELGLTPVTEHPADYVDALAPGDELDGAVAQTRGLPDDDPAQLDHLLALPQVHLIVDGYNVTKTGYPDLSLERQRTRLVTGLAALAAQSGAEVTCCFDGATVHGRVPALSARGVRVRFSRPGEIADELIRRLVRAEPAGRPVVVVSSDREVAEDVRRDGARPVPSTALVRRLARN